ncbi:hypothetical protein HK104_009127 [Borealophlyctis nickersoniae]|nr:hypothetical protein HK104_009127 [Borealophlyctis nickersoniae]
MASAALAVIGLDIEGIYRVPGSARRVKTWQETFDHNEFTDFGNEGVPTVASLLKSFFGTLPGSIFGSEEVKRGVVDILRSAEPNYQKLANLRTYLLTHLPSSAHYTTLAYFMNHLHRVSQHAENNRMHARNLALAIFPGLVELEWVISWAPDIFGRMEGGAGAGGDGGEDAKGNVGETMGRGSGDRAVGGVGSQVMGDDFGATHAPPLPHRAEALSPATPDSVEVVINEALTYPSSPAHGLDLPGRDPVVRPPPVAGSPTQPGSKELEELLATLGSENTGVVPVDSGEESEAENGVER